jgi:hypothetical protein
MAADVALERVRGSEAGFERDISLHHFARRLVGQADHRGLRHRFVLE